MKLSFLTSIDPLEPQIGVWPKRCAPDVLVGPLFGPLDERDAVPATLAVIDAAKVANLPEELDASGLPHRCLFQGNARQDWGHVAPWLVALSAEARLTRRLFTAAPPFGLWAAGAAMFLRADRSLDDLWRHFRKFTQVQDEDGKWLFFRFWQPQSLMMMHRSAHLPEARRFFAPCLRLVAPLPAENRCLMIEPDTMERTLPPTGDADGTDFPPALIGDGPMPETRLREVLA